MKQICDKWPENVKYDPFDDVQTTWKWISINAGGQCVIRQCVLCEVTDTEGQKLNNDKFTRTMENNDQHLSWGLWKYLRN